MKDILPEKIRTRVNKIGFATAEKQWMQQNQSLFLKKAAETVELTDQLIQPNVVDSCDTQLLWRVIHLGQWMKTFSIKT